MEFASRRTRVLALAGVALLTGGACRRRAPKQGPGEAAGPSSATLTLGGRVTDEVDRAIPGARVLAFGPQGDAAAATPPEARTDPRGRLPFGGPPPGRHTLLVEAAGLAAVTR